MKKKGKKPIGFIRSKKKTNFELTPAEKHHLESLLEWQRLSAKSTTVLGVPLKDQDYY